ncbi:MAG: heterodisulfide reductase-related iron-sulfur binding cluster [Planctomycetota bacterium]
MSSTAEQPRFAFPDTASELLRNCVHCGLCLGACPTYREVGNENDSPRGRLYIMKALSEGRLDPVPEVTNHLDLCLDCRACETACPSGVQYGQILEGTREALTLAQPPGFFARVLRSFFFKRIFPYPSILSIITKALRFQQRSGLRSTATKMGLFKLLPKRLRELEAMQPEIKEVAFLENAPDIFPADGGAPKLRVAFFSGCVMDQFMGDIHRATIKVLQAHGVEVLTVHGQQCCGALMVHSGEGNLARKLARQNLQMFRGLGVDAIVNNSAGCGAQLKDYHHLLHDDPEALAFSKLQKDVSEILAGLQPVRPLKPLEKTLCYDAPCHLMHAQKISAQPVAILQRIPGIKWVPLPDAEFCCGAAGIYNLTQPEMAEKILARKIEAIKGTGAELVSTGNPGCLMQIRNGCKAAGLTCEVLHPMELIARQLN